VRLVGTGITCVVAAFGAAFLIARAIDHQGAAHRTITTTTALTPRATTAVDVTLASQFVPDLTTLARPARPHPRPARHKRPAVAKDGR